MQDSAGGRPSRRALIIGAVALLAPVAAAAAPASRPFRAPRTRFGAPDLSGIWTNATYTRLERNKTFKTLVITPEEARVAEARYAKTGTFTPDQVDPLGQKDSEYWDVGDGMARVRGEIRTSFIVDTPDGRLPFRPEIVKQFHYDDPTYDPGYDNPEARTVMERCVASEGGYPPNLNSPDGNFLQIQQTPGYVTLLAEKYNDLRIVRMAGAAHDHPAVTSWAGDSVGHYEGDTLVIETTNFSPAGLSRVGRLKLSAQARIIERFTRTSPTDMLCAFTVTDPSIYTQTWNAEMPYRASKGPIYEYTCHEGNYAMPDMLRIGRQADQAAASKTQATAVTP